MSYFYDCINEKQAKEQYRRLSKEFHPDKGGSHAKMIDLQQQYDRFLKEINNADKFRMYSDEEYDAYEAYDFGYKRYEPKYRSPSYEYEQAEIERLKKSIYILDKKYNESLLLTIKQKQEIQDLIQTINSLKVINAGFPPKLDEKDEEINKLNIKLSNYAKFILLQSILLIILGMFKIADYLSSLLA